MNDARLRLPLTLAALPLIAFLVLPVAGLLLRASGEDILGTFLGYQAAQAVALSVTTTLTTVVLAVVFGTPAAYLLARKRFPGKSVIDALVDLPVVLPPSVAGIALLVTFGRRGLVGGMLAAAGIELPFTQAAVVMAQVFVAAPLYIRTVAVAFASVDRDLELAAAIDGASRWQAFANVTLPLSLRGAVGGAIMTWARALGEFGATIIFAGNFPGRTQTMPLAIYMGFELDLRVALTLAAILLVTSFTVLAAVKSLSGRWTDPA